MVTHPFRLVDRLLLSFERSYCSGVFGKFDLELPVLGRLDKNVRHRYLWYRGCCCFWNSAKNSSWRTSALSLNAAVSTHVTLELLLIPNGQLGLHSRWSLCAQIKEPIAFFLVHMVAYGTLDVT